MQGEMELDERERLKAMAIVHGMYRGVYCVGKRHKL